LIRVQIETASEVTRAGLEALLREHSGIELVGSAADADVLLCDEAPEFSDLAAAVPVVVLTDELPAQHAWRSGVRGMLPRDAPAAQIIAAIYAASAGLVVLQADDTMAILPTPAEQPAEPLTPRELEALDMLAEGLSNKLIAHKLGISEHTAKFHVNSILAKLNAGTRTEAVMRGVRLGLVKI
jgi:two-component system, NarL family, nitrate/nitrite response regulator NarL